MFGLDTAVARIIGGILVVLAIFGFGYYRGYSAVTLQFSQYKAEVHAAAESQAKESAKIDEINAKRIKEAQDAYSNQLAALRAYYSMRYGKSGGSVPQVSDPTSLAFGYSPDNLPPTSILAGQCAETTLNLIALQNFVRGAMNNAE